MKSKDSASCREIEAYKPSFAFPEMEAENRMYEHEEDRITSKQLADMERMYRD